MPAGGADGGPAPERTLSLDGVSPSTRRREPSLPRARSRQRFCGISSPPLRPDSMNVASGQCPARRRRDRLGGALGRRPQGSASLPREAVLRSPPRQCRTLPAGRGGAVFQAVPAVYEGQSEGRICPHNGKFWQCLTEFGSTESLPSWGTGTGLRGPPPCTLRKSGSELCRTLGGIETSSKRNERRKVPLVCFTPERPFSFYSRPGINRDDDDDAGRLDDHGRSGDGTRIPGEGALRRGG